jgi:hypothetical protein
VDGRREFLLDASYLKGARLVVGETDDQIIIGVALKNYVLGP